MNRKKFLIAGLVILASMFQTNAVQAERIKDLARVAGVRDNQLIGYGLVVGLDGTGDGKTSFTVQSMKSMLSRFGVRVPTDDNPQLKNVAAVTVHANLPPFAKPGQNIDITASTIGGAKSLLGGSLLMTPLQGADGKIYAIAQGNLVVGGFGASTDDGNSISVNIPTVGRIPNGATVERQAPTVLGSTDAIILNLNQSDFTTAKRIADAINEAIGEGAARAFDNTSVQVSAPLDASQRVAFLSIIENISLEPAEAAAKVVVNSRTGTVVIGRHVRVSAAAVAHGRLTVTIGNTPTISQPSPLSAGQTVVVPNSEIRVEEEDNRMFLFKPGVSLDDIVRAINQVGAAPGDLVVILEALKQAGALRAELIII